MQTAGPLEHATQFEGGTRGLLHGHPVVLYYGDWTTEYAALKRSVGLVCLGHTTQIEITGADRALFLNRLCTNKVDGLGPGEGRETFLTDAKGHVLAHAAVFARSGSLVLRAAGSEAETIIAHLDFYLIRDDVQLHDRSGECLELLLAGPDAAGLLGQLTSAEMPQSLLAHSDVEWAGGPVSVRCVQMDLAPVFLLSLPGDNAADVWHVLRKAGVAACGHQALETLRIEAGWPVYGQDINPSNLPQEVGRNAQAISFTKGCYLGQETVARLDSRGHVNKVLVGLKFATAGVPAGGDELASAGQGVGVVTSAAFSPDFGAAIGLGYVRRGFEQPGTLLDGPHGPAVVVALPMSH